MAMRAATMSPSDTSQFAGEPSYFMRKLVLLLLLVTASAFGIVFLFPQGINFPALLTAFFADASLGLIAGFGSRIVLASRGSTSRFIVAIVVTVIGMILLGSLAHWKVGLGPFEVDPRVVDQIRQISLERNLADQIGSMKIDPQTLLSLRGMDWADAAHLAISITLAVMCLQAWPQTRAQTVEVVPLSESESAPPSRRRKRTASSSTAQPRIQLPGGWLPQLGGNGRLRPRSRSRNGSRSPVLKEAKDFEQAARPKRRNAARRKPNIQFALVEEHRCPYCLDAVTHNDPRGVKECEVCHTLHHADCWSITGGTCQVPHLNT